MQPNFPTKMGNDLNKRLSRVERLLNQVARRDERGELDRMVSAAIVETTLDFLTRQILGLPQTHDWKVKRLAEALGKVEAFRTEAHRRARAIRVYLALEGESSTEVEWWKVIGSAEKIRRRGACTQIEAEFVDLVSPWDEEQQRKEALVQMLFEWISECRAELKQMGRKERK